MLKGKSQYWQYDPLIEVWSPKSDLEIIIFDFIFFSIGA